MGARARRRVARPPVRRLADGAHRHRAAADDARGCSPTTTDASSTTTASTPAPAPPPPAATTTPTGVTVTGYALNYADIARTLARLQAVPSLTSAELESATPTKLGNKRVIQFTIVAALATPGGVQ